MRKFTSLLLAVCICFACFLPVAWAEQSTLPSSLSSLTHNCPNTGIMIPEEFDPLVYTYLLTVASWVNRVTFVPVSVDPDAVIDMNGKQVISGETSQIFTMTDEPQLVTITVSTAGMEKSVYSVYLQRRPSIERTKVSAGYLNDMRVEDEKTYLVMDLVTVTYTDGIAVSFTNDPVSDQFTYPVTDECLFYYGSAENPVHANDMADFKAHVSLGGNDLFTVIYIEDEIVIILPFAYGLAKAS